MSMTRIIFRCRMRVCRHAWAHEYAKTQVKPGMYREQAGESVEYGSDLRRGCPQCGSQYIKADRVRGVYNEHVKCNAVCQMAMGPSCSCSCGGANHGAGLVAGKKVMQPGKEEQSTLF